MENSPQKLFQPQETGEQQAEIPDVIQKKPRPKKISAITLATMVALSNVLSGDRDARPPRPTIEKVKNDEGEIRSPKIEIPKPRFDIPTAKKEVKFACGTSLKRIAASEVEKLTGKTGLAEKLRWQRPEELQRIREECEFYDPHHSGNPLLLILPADLEKPISKYFKVKDLVLIDAKDLKYAKPGFYQEHQGNYYRVVARIDPELLAVIDGFNEAAQKETKKSGTVITVNEGFRPYGETIATALGNHDEVHPRGLHTSGRALDFNKNIPDLQRIGLTALAQWGKGGGIGLHGPTTLHIDTRNGEKITWWGYGKGQIPKELRPYCKGFDRPVQKKRERIGQR